MVWWAALLGGCLVITLAVVVAGLLVCCYYLRVGGYVVWVGYSLCVVIWCVVCIGLDCWLGLVWYDGYVLLCVLGWVVFVVIVYVAVLACCLLLMAVGGWAGW